MIFRLKFARGFQDYSGVFEGCHIPELPYRITSSGNAARAQYFKTISNIQKHKFSLQETKCDC